MEAIKFLGRDFDQCFTQMRHYDGQIWDICKFSFAAYSALMGTAFGLYQYTISPNHVNLIPVAIAILVIGVLLGLFIFGLSLRNRVYFVVLARYINENREYFFRHNPPEFKNVTGMYTDPSNPPFFIGEVPK